MDLLELQIGHTIAYVKVFNVNGKNVYVNIHTGEIEHTFDYATAMRIVQRNMYCNEINNCRLPENYN